MLLKYMGSADVRLIEAGTDFAGRLKTPTEKTLRWDKDNNWIVDTDEAGLSPEAVSLLAAEPGFLDVTESELVPVNDHQKIFHALTDPEPVDKSAAEVNSSVALTEPPAPAEPVEGTARAPRAGRTPEPVTPTA